MTKGKVKISDRALTARINRALAKEDRKLSKSRSPSSLQEFGELYIVDAKRGIIVQSDVSLEALGRELNVLQNYEELE